MRWIVFSLSVLFVVVAGCGKPNPSSDAKQQAEQERILSEGTASVGMPNIHNFRERRLLKQILEMRDQDGIVTFTYIVDLNGRLVFLGESIGYGIPYATQFTNPSKLEYADLGEFNGEISIPQADPNGLFSPSSAEGTWVMLKDPHGKDVKPILVEPRIVVSPFKLH
jgi:hypothetical protein